MKRIFILFFALSFTQVSFGQVTDKMRQEGVTKGTIILKGKEVEGYIKRMGTTSLSEEWYSAPWQFQKKIQFIGKDIFENKDKIKNKDYNKYSPKDIDGYKYNGDSLIYISAKYADMSAVGTGMLAKQKFIRKVSEGKISIYHHFQTPPPAGEVSSLRETYKEYANPDVVYQKGEKGKLKLVNSLNVEKELSDCSTVVEKYKNGDYGVSKDKEKKSGLAKLADKTVFRDGIRLAVIEDYNNTCQ